MHLCSTVRSSHIDGLKIIKSHCVYECLCIDKVGRDCSHSSRLLTASAAVIASIIIIIMLI